jgi:hypothetical protein
MKPYKATRSETVPNSVLVHAREELVPHLGPLFRATNTLEYYPQEWALTETLIWKKPGKPDYTSPSAWCPIVLSDGMACLLNSGQTDDIITMCKKHDILQANHFGARPGCTTTDSIHLLTKTVKDTWHKGQVVSTLFLGIKGAFPSVDVNCLIHNMRKRGIPQEYTEWIKRRLENRHTTLSFDDYQTTTFAVLNDLDQGDPFSGICYLIYNADLLKIPILRLGEWILLFVDNAVVIVIGKDFLETHIEKFQLLNITKRLTPHPLNPRKWIPMPRHALILENQHIPSKETARFLGVMVDNKLNWKVQCTAAITKEQDWLIQFGRLSWTS